MSIRGPQNTPQAASLRIGGTDGSTGINYADVVSNHHVTREFCKAYCDSRMFLARTETASLAKNAHLTLSFKGAATGGAGALIYAISAQAKNDITLYLKAITTVTGTESLVTANVLSSGFNPVPPIRSAINGSAGKMTLNQTVTGGTTIFSHPISDGPLAIYSIRLEACNGYGYMVAPGIDSKVFTVGVSSDAAATPVVLQVSIFQPL